jgi:biotin synthase
LKRLSEILDKVRGGGRMDRADSKFLLEIDERSYASGLVRAAASSVVRSATDNAAIILGQIGVEVSPCPADCKFCTFGEGHTRFERSKITDEALSQKIHDFCKDGDLYGLYLMTMHTYDVDFYLNTVRKARRLAPPATQIWANIGDTDADVLKEIKKNGVTGIYHVLRLREGADTRLKPENRLKTMRNAIDAGLELYTCIEPIGPEHTNDEIVENLFATLDLGIVQHAAMRRVAVPGSPLFQYGQISELRLAHIVAVVALATARLPKMAYIGTHEPNELSYLAGANIATAESGANPRDVALDTAKGRGRDVADCRKMFFECGFTNLRRGDESNIPLDFGYLVKTRA